VPISVTYDTRQTCKSEDLKGISMLESARSFFESLLNTPGPSGYEQDVQNVVREYASTFADEVSTDVHGNVTIVVNPDATRRIMLAGHCDQIGMIVSHIDDNGFIYAQTIGGWDPQQLIGQRMIIWSEAGPINALISRKAIHLLTDQERKQVVKLKDMWLDIGASSGEEASAMINIGDPVTLELGIREMQGNLANAPKMDNSCGVWVVVEAIRRAKELDPQCGIYAVSTVAEEIGLRGARTSAFGINPDIGVAVDVTHSTDCPSVDKKQLGDIRLGNGPVVYRGPNMNHKVVRQLLDLATTHNIPVQPAAVGRATSNDANALQLNRAGVATGLVSIPNRYMHSAVETISLDDIDNAAELLGQFCANVTTDEDYTPA
jgi:endoglucanase